MRITEIVSLSAIVFGMVKSLIQMDFLSFTYKKHNFLIYKPIFGCQFITYARSGLIYFYDDHYSFPYDNNVGDAHIDNNSKLAAITYWNNM